MRNMPLKNIEKRREYMRKYMNEHYRNNEHFREYRLAQTKKYAPKAKENRANKKFSVMAIYCEGQPRCTCCGEPNIEFLTFDHINNDGAKQRKEIHIGFKKHGYHFYVWLIKHNFPEGYQVLCWNCNCAKGFYGYCPHSFSKR